VAVAPPKPAAEQRDEYEPRPYAVTFDHKSSCFDEQTYAAKVRDIDAPSATVSSHHAKLVRELDAFYRKHETKYLPEADYIGTVQKDINEKMRTILVDWLVEVGEEYELDSQTFHKAVRGWLFSSFKARLVVSLAVLYALQVNLVDRCLKKIKINRKQFQLLGCACMMVAAKFEEVYGPSVEEFVYISDQTYTAEEVRCRLGWFAWRV
jgi:cyclin A